MGLGIWDWDMGYRVQEYGIWNWDMGLEIWDPQGEADLQ